MRHESQAMLFLTLVILLATGCHERKTNNNKALLEKNYLELVHPQLPLFFPLHILPQFKMNLKDFPCHSFPPPSGLAILSLDEELHLQPCGHAGYRDCLGGDVSAQAILASEVCQARIWQIRTVLSPERAPPSQYKFSLPGMTTKTFPESYPFASSVAELRG